MKLCRNCGAQCDDAFFFCSICGTALPAAESPSQQNANQTFWRADSVPQRPSPAKKPFVWAICIGALVLVSCIAVFLYIHFSPINRNNVPAYIPTHDKGNVDQEMSDNSHDSSPTPTAKPSIRDIISEKQDLGEIDGCYYGETRHLVYKKIEATFNKAAYYTIGIIDSEGNYILPLQDEENAGSLGDFIHHDTGYLGTNHMGHLNENMFVIAMEYYYKFFNADELTSFGVAMQETNNSGYVLSEINGSPILENKFHDGVAITYRSYHYDRYSDDKEYQAMIIDKNGEIKRINAYLRIKDWWIESTSDNPAKGNMSVGIYSDGLLWAFGSFYDIEGTLLIDLSDYKITNIPKFVGGTCQLTIKQNGKIWSVEINKSGEFLHDPIQISD